MSRKGHVWIVVYTVVCRSYNKCSLLATEVGESAPDDFIEVQGIRNDDQSPSPVTPLASLLFLSFLIP